MTTTVTPKDVPAIRFKQFLRKQAEPMYQAIQTVQADPGWKSLSVLILLTAPRTTRRGIWRNLLTT